jgi:hypothetical protein
MAKPTILEEDMLKQLETDADALCNGNSDDQKHQGKVISQMARVLVALVRSGVVTPRECGMNREALKSDVEAAAKNALAESKSDMPDFIRRTPLALVWASVPPQVLIFVYFVGRGRGYW